MLQPLQNWEYEYVQIYCDGDRNTFIVDKDGSLLGEGKKGTLVPFNELGWKDPLRYVDALGRETMEALIPFTAQYRIDGTRIVPLQGATKLYDKPGIWRDGCTFHTGWGAYKCPDAEHRQIVFESMDRDHRNRRLSPTSVLTELNGKRYMALYTGPGRYKIDWSGKIKRIVTLWVRASDSHCSPHVTDPKYVLKGKQQWMMCTCKYGVANRVDLYVKNRLFRH